MRVVFVAAILFVVGYNRVSKADESMYIYKGRLVSFGCLMRERKVERDKSQRRSIVYDSVTVYHRIGVCVIRRDGFLALSGHSTIPCPKTISYLYIHI
jgi:hypothetical protein